MKEIFNETLEAVSHGAKFHVDFQTRTLRVGKQTIINDGQFDGNLGIEKTTLSEALQNIEHYFFRYRHSIPSERSESKRKKYFSALPEHLLDDDDMLYGDPREQAQAALELYVLGCIINGSLVWDEASMGKWFWQSSVEPNLVILKQWITNNNN